MNPLSAISPLSSLDPASVAGLPRAIPLPEKPDAVFGGSAAGAISAPSKTGDFGSVLGNLVQAVNGKQIAAGDTVNGMLSGQNVSLHQAMIAMEEANVSFQLMVEVRNKLLESYQELMRMQV